MERSNIFDAQFKQFVFESLNKHLSIKAKKQNLDCLKFDFSTRRGKRFSCVDTLRAKIAERNINILFSFYVVSLQPKTN
jgi:hypothetical protein